MTITCQEDSGEFFQSMVLKNVEDDFKWELVNTYGPVQDEKKVGYLQELLVKTQSNNLPTIIGGDFNLVRKAEDKSSGNVDGRFMRAFNDFILDSNLMELQKIGSKYTWSNKQLSPIFSNLDRVLVNNEWEDKYPLIRVQTYTRIGSDHNPLIVDIGAQELQAIRYFRFDPTWLTQTGFKNWVRERWPQRHKPSCLDHWHVVSAKLRRTMRGWGANFGSDIRKHKQQLM